jgi:hypothetical protein
MLKVGGGYFLGGLFVGELKFEVGRVRLVETLLKPELRLKGPPG